MQEEKEKSMFGQSRKSQRDIVGKGIDAGRIGIVDQTRKSELKETREDFKWKVQSEM
jgi:hypothetical protein